LSSSPQAVFYRLHRPEFLQTLKRTAIPAVSSDVLTCWGKVDAAAHNGVAKQASAYLLSEQMDAVVADMFQRAPQPDEIVAGLNQYVDDQQARLRRRNEELKQSSETVDEIFKINMQLPNMAAFLHRSSTLSESLHWMSTTGGEWAIYFHGQGLSLRYLGLLLERVGTHKPRSLDDEKVEQASSETAWLSPGTWLQRKLLVEIVQRCVKHILREHLRTLVGDEFTEKVVAVLNGYLDPSTAFWKIQVAALFKEHFGSGSLSADTEESLHLLVKPYIPQILKYACEGAGLELSKNCVQRLHQWVGASFGWDPVTM